MPIEKYSNSKLIDTNNVINPQTTEAGAIRDSGMSRMVDTLDKWLGQAADTLDRKTVERARQNGAMAGLKPNLELADGESLAAQAFNRSAVEVFVNQTTVDASTRVNKLTNTPGLKANPKALRSALDGVEAEMLKSMPDMAVPDFRLGYNNLVERSVQSAQVNQFSEQLAAASATFKDAERTMLINLSNAAREGDAGFIEKEMPRYFNMLDRNGSVIDGGTGVNTPGQNLDSKLAVEKMVSTQMQIGKLLRTPDAEKPAFIEGMVTELMASSELLPDEKIGVVNDIVQAFDAQTAVQDKVSSQLKATQKAEVRELEKKFILDPSEQNYTELINHPGAEPSDMYQAYTHFSQRIQESNPITYKHIDSLIQEGRFSEAQEQLSVTNSETFDQISSEDRTALSQRIVQGQEGGGFQDTNGWQETVKRINADNSIMSAFGVPQLSAEGEQIRREIYDYMRDQWPRYQRGELKEMPDPIRQYNLKKSAHREANNHSSVEVTISTGEAVPVPKKWVDDPTLYRLELKSKTPMATRYKDPVFKEYMADKMSEKGSKQ